MESPTECIDTSSSQPQGVELSEFWNALQSSRPGTNVSLSDEQVAAVDRIDTHLGTSVATGQAGSGKTTLINALRTRTDRFGKPRFAVCATIGKAAMPIDGVTVDSMFALSRSSWTIFSERILERNMMATPRNIIIDEGSFIGTRMGDMLYEIAHDFDKRLILVGDWGQASPVQDGPFLQSSLSNEYDFVKLWENHRQDDPELIAALNDIRVGNVSECASRVFADRVCPTPPEDDRYLRLYGTNKRTDRYNNYRLWTHVAATNTLPLAMEADFVDKRDDYLQKRYPYSESYRDNAIRDSRFAHTDTWFSEGCRVVVTANNVSSVNGDTGTLVHLIVGRPDRLRIFGEDGNKELDHGETVVGAVVRLDRTGTEVSIGRQCRSHQNPVGQATFDIEGLPLRLGYAMTIHKAQGMTVPYAWFDMGSLARFPRESRHGLAYVALSRVRTREGLLISSWEPDLVYCDPAVIPLL